MSMNIDINIGCIIIGLLFFSGQAIFAQADAGRDTIICSGDMVTIGWEGCDDCCYSWQPATGLDDAKSSNPSANPTSTTTYTLTVVGKDFSFMDTDDMEVKVANVEEVEFEEILAEPYYGFDNYSNSEIFSMSIEKGTTEMVKSIITPSTDFDEVYFKSTEADNVSVSPANATSATSQITLTGDSEGQSFIEANCGSIEGTNLGNLSVEAYDLKTLTVKVIVVHEQNDDVQEIEPGQGNPAMPNQVCISPGSNGFRDTPIGFVFGDDEIVGKNVLTGLDGICNTLAINEDASSTGYDLTAITSFLNNIVYKQAVIQWTVVDGNSCTTNFDLNRDQEFEDLPWSNPERDSIIANCKDDAYDKNIFLVDNPNTSTVVGRMDFNQKYGFVYVNEILQSGGTGCLTEQVFAHELGHGLGLMHTPSDAKNLMFPNCDNGAGVWRLRSTQWDGIRE